MLAGEAHLKGGCHLPDSVAAIVSAGWSGSAIVALRSHMLCMHREDTHRLLDRLDF